MLCLHMQALCTHCEVQKKFPSIRPRSYYALHQNDIVNPSPIQRPGLKNVLYEKSFSILMYLDKGWRKVIVRRMN